MIFDNQMLEDQDCVLQIDEQQSGSAFGTLMPTTKLEDEAQEGPGQNTLAGYITDSVELPLKTVTVTRQSRKMVNEDLDSMINKVLGGGADVMPPVKVEPRETTPMPNRIMTSKSQCKE